MDEARRGLRDKRPNAAREPLRVEDESARSDGKSRGSQPPTTPHPRNTAQAFLPDGCLGKHRGPHHRYERCGVTGGIRAAAQLSADGLFGKHKAISRAVGAAVIT